MLQKTLVLLFGKCEANAGAIKAEANFNIYAGSQRPMGEGLEVDKHSEAALEYFSSLF